MKKNVKELISSLIKLKVELFVVYTIFLTGEEEVVLKVDNPHQNFSKGNFVL